MNKLSLLEGLPRPDPARVAPHNFRRLGRRVLLTNDSGGYAFLSLAEYRAFLQGLGEGHPLKSSLQGFLKDSYDLEVAAQEVRRTLLAWRGPSRHLLALEREGQVMGLETARRVLDFAFSGPAPELTLELAAGDPEKAWPAIWFAVQYGRRKSEWGRRPLSLVLRTGASLVEERLKFLRGHSVGLRAVLALKGAPGGGLPFEAQSLLALVEPSAVHPAAWVDWISARGVSSARLWPAALGSRRELRLFLRFYARALERLLASGKPWSEETSAAFLSRSAWRLPGTDLLSELAYDPSGQVYTSEAGMALGPSSPFRLGEAGLLRYQDSAQSLGRACVAACLAENQPLCAQCAYKPYCTLPPSLNFRSQGTLWGQTPSSLLCSLHMGILDLLFGALGGIYSPPPRGGEYPD